MKTKVLLILCGLFLAAGCSYESEPPLTDSSRSTYVLPKGEVPTEAERAQAQAAKTEYENYLQP